MNENVILIPARKKPGNNVIKETNKPKLKVAAYCRVSTDTDEQAGSYETQVAHYTDFINKNRDWELAGIYADDGISGTNTKKREGFNEMINDCCAGKIDLVITKSISRFARNTLDCLKYVRMLKDKNIPIIFEKENINTMEASGELLLTIMASLAQQESQSLSQNVKLGLQFRYQNGQIQINHNYFLGYTKDSNGKLIIDEEQAKVVKRIFKEFLEGRSAREIGDDLERDGVKTGSGGSKWQGSTIMGILKNEKYIGDALLQKTVTVDFIEKTRIKNDGSYPQYYVTDDHEAIIPRDIFIQVQEEIARRANMSVINNTVKRMYSYKHELSNVCTCTKCGDLYRRVYWNCHGHKHYVYRCYTRIKEGPKACTSSSIYEDELQQAVVDAINQVLKCSSSMKTILLENVKIAIADDNSGDLYAINELLQIKQKELMKLARAKKDYTSIAEDVDKLKERKHELMVTKSNTEEYKRRIAELEQFISTADEKVIEYNDNYVKKYIKEIKIYKDKLEIFFKAGIKIDIQRKKIKRGRK